METSLNPGSDTVYKFVDPNKGNKSLEEKARLKAENQMPPPPPPPLPPPAEERESESGK